MILLKVQIPLVTNDENPPALVYDRTRVFERFVEIDEKLRELMSGRPKAFFECKVANGRIQLLKEVPDPGW